MGEDTEFGIESEEAFVAAAQVACSSCGERIEVVCVHCYSGVDLETGDALEQFTLSNISSVDDALVAMLAPRRYFKTAPGAGGEEEYFANHCVHCGAVQEDYLLHSEPGDVFFCIAESEPGSVQLTAIKGRIGVSGDWGFGV